MKKHYFAAYPALTLRAELASDFVASRFDPGRGSCVHCGYIYEACDCDLHTYRGAFEEPRNIIQEQAR